MEYGVIFQLDQESPAAVKALINQTKNALNAIPGLQVEWALHGNAVNLLRKDLLSEAALTMVEVHNAFSELEQLGDVKILACKNALDSRGLVGNQLLTFVTIIPSAVGRLITRQSEGWSYIKIGS